MDGSSVNKDEFSAPQQNEVERVRLAALLRNAMQLINSGSVYTGQNRFHVATNPARSSCIVGSGLPLQPKLLQQRQNGWIRSTAPPASYRAQMPFRHGENSHTTFYRCFRAARWFLIPRGGHLVAIEGSQVHISFHNQLRPANFFF